MSPSLKPFVVGLFIAFVLAAALQLLFAVTGATSPGAPMWVLPLVIGSFVATTMSRMAGNRAERRVRGGDRDAALALVPPPGAALVVVTREGFPGKAVGLDVAVDGRVAVQLRSPRGAVLRVAPGRHEVAASNPNGVGDSAGASLMLTVAPGEVAFLELRFALGVADGVVKLDRAADPARARATLAKLTMIAPEPEWVAAA